MCDRYRLQIVQMKVFSNKPLHRITYGCAMTQAVSCKPFNLKAPGKSMWICGGQIVTGTGFIQVLRLSCTTLISTMFHSYSLIYLQHLAVESIIIQHNSQTHHLSACLKVCGLTVSHFHCLLNSSWLITQKNNFGPFFLNVSGTIQLLINRFPWNLIFVYFLKNSQEK